MIQGKCLCGKIKYSLSSELLYLYNCHCSQCKAFSGSSFATNASVLGKDLYITDANKSLKAYESKNGYRYFCQSCGSPIYSCGKNNDKFLSIHCGSIINFPEKKLDANLWVSERCPWTSIDKNVNNFESGLK